MKRLVNAYGLHQATHFLESRSVSPEALAQWTIIELRWPLLADLLAAHPEFITALAEGKKPADKNIPDNLNELFGHDDVKRVVSGSGKELIVAMDEAAIREIVGLSGDAVQTPRQSSTQHLHSPRGDRNA